MSQEECVSFAKKALFQAMYHDGSSGGVIRVAVITKDGVHREVHTISGRKITELK